MTNKQYILSRCALRKAAADIPVITPIVDVVKNVVSGAGKKLSEEAIAQLKLALPVSSIGLAWLLARASSPAAVADNAHEYAINAMEKETLVQSIRDWENSKLSEAMRAKKHKVHDQFI